MKILVWMSLIAFEQKLSQMMLNKQHSDENPSSFLENSRVRSHSQRTVHTAGGKVDILNPETDMTNKRVRPESHVRADPGLENRNSENPNQKSGQVSKGGCHLKVAQKHNQYSCEYSEDLRETLK